MNISLGIYMLKFWTVLSKMGIIFSRFRKKSSIDLLEKVEEEIKELEACSADTELRHRKITRQLMVYSSGLCFVFALLLYFYVPPKLVTKIILVALLMLSPLIYYLVNRLISWYYNRKIKSSHSRLKDLKKEKKRLIDEIMEKETYKVAKEILEKYAPETLPKKYPPVFGTGPPQPNRPATMAYTFPPPAQGKLNGAQQQLTQRIVHVSNQPRPFAQPPRGLPALMAAPPVQTRPQYPTSKSYAERIFEYLIGDGPNSRYALICNNCSTHNGMTLVEEFEYTAFKCYACQTFNPARKQRPVAPKLEFDKSDQDEESEGESGSSTGSDRGEVKIEEVEDDGDEAAKEGEAVTSTDDITKAEAEEVGSSEKDEWSKEVGSVGSDASTEEANKTEAGVSNGGDAESEFDLMSFSHDLTNRQIKSDSAINGPSDFQSS